MSGRDLADPDELASLLHFLFRLFYCHSLTLTYVYYLTVPVFRISPTVE